MHTIKRMLSLSSKFHTEVICWVWTCAITYPGPTKAYIHTYLYPSSGHDSLRY